MKDQNLIDKSAMHFINMPRVVETVFNLFLSLSNEMYRKMIKVHQKGGQSKLTEELGLEILPPQYQGTGITIKVSLSKIYFFHNVFFLKEVTDFWLTEMKNNGMWLKNETKFKSDETKRAGKAISHADVFGVEGSLRKLDID